MLIKYNLIVTLFYMLLDGQICLDVLQMPPVGSYNPAITLESILLSIQLLLGSPNADDPLRNDVSDEYRYNRARFNEQATKLSGNKEKTIQSNENEVGDRKMEVEVKLQLENKIETKTDGETSAPKATRKRKHDGA